MSDSPHTGKFTHLRQQAESILQDQNLDIGDLTTADIQQIIHDLRVHQVELEMQNDELNRTQNELVQMHRKYADLYDLAPVGYIILDEDGVIMEANLTSAALLAAPFARLAGASLSDFVAQADQDKYYLHHQALFGAGKSAPLDLILKRTGEVDLPIRIQGTVVNLSNGSARCAYVALTDMSGQRLAEHDRDEAKEADRLKTLFLAQVSHELRTPLTSILGYASTLLATDVEWTIEQYQDFIGIIRDEAQKMVEMANQLMDAARLQAGTLAIHTEATHVQAVVSTARAQLDILAAQHTLDIQLPADLSAVVADRIRIAQVLTNLVSNATKHSPDGTHITLSAMNGGPFVQIEVSDQGYGIPPEQREMVFEPFHQGETGAAKGGVGLGLAICRGIIEAHGGKIWVKDQPAPGTTIAFTLPAAR